MKKTIITTFLILSVIAITSPAEAKVKDKKATATTAPTSETRCMQAAIEKRDLAVIVSFDIFSSSTRTAITNRSEGLKSAWNNQGGKRAQTLRDTWQNFRKVKSQITQQNRQTINNAWKNFYTDRRNCGPAAAQADITTEQVDRIE